MPHYDIEKLANTIGIDDDFVAAGKHKVPVTLFKKMSIKDKAYLKKQLLSPTYKVFKNFVKINRNLTDKQINSLAEGIIYAASMKVVQGTLIDKTDSLIGVEKELKNKISTNKHVGIKKIGFVEYNLKANKGKSILGLDVDVKTDTFFPNVLKM